MSCAEVMAFKRRSPEERNRMFLLLDYDIQSKAEELSQILSETTSKTATLLENTSALSSVLTTTSTSLVDCEAKVIDINASNLNELEAIRHTIAGQQQEYTVIHTELGTKLDEQAREINDIGLKNKSLQKCLKKAQKKAKKTEKKVEKQAETLEKLNRMHESMKEELLGMRREFEAIQQQQNEAKIHFASIYTQTH